MIFSVFNSFVEMGFFAWYPISIILSYLMAVVFSTFFFFISVSEEWVSLTLNHQHVFNIIVLVLFALVMAKSEEKKGCHICKINTRNMHFRVSYRKRTRSVYFHCLLIWHLLYAGMWDELETELVNIPNDNIVRDNLMW